MDEGKRCNECGAEMDDDDPFDICDDCQADDEEDDE